MGHLYFLVIKDRGIPNRGVQIGLRRFFEHLRGLNVLIFENGAWLLGCATLDLELLGILVLIQKDYYFTLRWSIWGWNLDLLHVFLQNLVSHNFLVVECFVLNGRRKYFRDTLTCKYLLALLRGLGVSFRNSRSLFLKNILLRTCHINFMRLRPDLTGVFDCMHWIGQLQVFSLFVKIWRLWRLLSSNFWIVYACKLSKLLSALKPVTNDSCGGAINWLSDKCILHEFVDFSFRLLILLITLVNLAETNLTPEGRFADSPSPVAFFTISHGSLIPG